MRKEFNDLKVRFFGVLVVIFILFFLVAPLQKFTLSMLEGYTGNPQLEKFLPGSMLNKLKEWNFYVNSQWYGKNFGQMIPIIGIIMAFPLFAREFENRTIEFLLVRKSRKEIFLNKVLTGFIALSVILIIAGLLPLVYSFLLRKDYIYETGLKFVFQSYFAGLLWYGIGIFFSVLFNDQVKPLLAGLGTLAITTVAGLLKPLKFLNTFSYALGTNIFQKNFIDFKYTICAIIFTIVSFIFAYIIFNKKEA